MKTIHKEDVEHLLSGLRGLIASVNPLSIDPVRGTEIFLFCRVNLHISPACKAPTARN